MTVSTTDSEVVYVSGGPAFPIPYRFLQNADIEAVLVKQDGTSETLTGAQYTLSGAGSQSGGTLTSSYAAGILATPGASLTISRVMDAVQPTDLRNQGKYLAETHENVFDRLTMLIQQGFSGLSRALKRPAGKSYFDAEGRIISNVSNPVSGKDASNKIWTETYVGSIIGTGQGPLNNAANVLYAAAGGVTRSVKSKLDETPSVIDYGADQSGASNSTASFDIGSDKEFQVLVPAGSYFLDADVQGYFDLQNGVTFTGPGMALSKGRGFWVNDGDGADIKRFTDRVFIGEAAEKSRGVKENGGVGTWLTTVLGASYLEREAHLLCVSGFGEYGGVFATRTSDKSKLGNYGDSSIAVAGVVFNDSASPSQIGWAGYMEATRVSNNTTFGVEFAVKNLGNNTAANPYSYFGGAIGAWFAGGGDPSYGGAPSNPSDTAILIGKNGASWNRGIVFGATGISGTDGVTGLGTAVNLAKGHVVQWSFNDGGTIRPGGEIVSEVNSPNQGQRLDFQNGSFNVKGYDSAGAPIDWFIFSGPVAPSGQTVCGLFFGAQSAGTGYATVGTQGADANMDLRLKPSGSGVIRFGYNSQVNGTPSAFSATRRITVRTEDGTTLYIPASTTVW